MEAVSPRGLLQKYKDHTRYRKAQVYFLCAGAYVPCDYHLIHAYPGKMLRFGYFPETRHYEAGQPFDHKEPGSILWAADDRLEASGAGGESSILFKRTSGRKYVSYYHDRRRGTGGRDASSGRGTRSDRRDHLSRFSRPGRSPGGHGKSEIYLVTSDRKEGWGAVVNEA